MPDNDVKGHLCNVGSGPVLASFAQAAATAAALAATCVDVGYSELAVALLLLLGAAISWWREVALLSLSSFWPLRAGIGGARR